MVYIGVTQANKMVQEVVELKDIGETSAFDVTL